MINQEGPQEVDRDSTTFEWTWRRKNAARGIALAVATFPIVIWGLYSYWPIRYLEMSSAAPLELALQCLVVVPVFCFFMFTRTARLFDLPAAEDVLAGEPGAESASWQKNSRIYQNTVEQSLMFAFSLLALSTVVPPEQAHIMPVLATCWLFGRIVFFVSYHIEPSHRAFGFDYTLFPSLVALGWYAFTLVSS